MLRDNHAENAGRRQLRSAHVIVIEQAAGRIADGVEIADRMIFRVEHFAFSINQRAAEGGRHAALERDNIEGRRINDRSLVTGVGRRELARIAAGNGLVEVLDGLLQRLGIDAGRFGGFFERLAGVDRRLGAGVGLPVVFQNRHVVRLLIADHEGPVIRRHARDIARHLHIGLTFIGKANALAIDADAVVDNVERVGAGQGRKSDRSGTGRR